MTRKFVCLAGLALLAVAALAASAHFIKAAVNINNDGDLVFTWKEAGLGNGDVSYLASANASAVYACINGGGNHPKASNKETVSEAVSSTGTFSPKNGTITGSLVVEPPGPGAFSCPNGQQLVIASVTYTDASLLDQSNGVYATLSGNCASNAGCKFVFFNLQ